MIMKASIYNRNIPQSADKAKLMAVQSVLKSLWKRRWHAVVALLLLYVFITYETDIRNLFDNKIVSPYLQHFIPNWVSVLLMAVMVIVCIFLFVFKIIRSLQPNYTSFFVTSAICVIGWYYRFSGYYIYTPLFRCITYYDVALCLLSAYCATTMFVTIKHIVLSKSHKRQSHDTQPFLPDCPVTYDMMNRENHAEILLQKLQATYHSGHTKQGAFTILLNEQYGAGKSSFMNLLKQKAEDLHITCITYKPWLCESANDMTKELFAQIERHYGYTSKVGTMLRKYARGLTGENSHWILHSIKSALFYNQSLEEQHDRLVLEMQSLSKPTMVLVDDVDRLDKEELKAFLKLIRTTADFPNIFYIVAADKTYLQEMLHNLGVLQAELFLRKFFNFEMLFPKDDGDMHNLFNLQCQMVLTDYGKTDTEVWTILIQMEKLKSLFLILQNPRDVYRYMNMVSYALDSAMKNKILEELYIPDLLQLLLIQYIDSNVYKILRDNDDKVLYIQNDTIHVQPMYKEMVEHIQQSEEKIIQPLSSFLAPQDNKDYNPCNNINEVHARLIPSCDKMIVRLLLSLFPDTNTTEINRIYYPNEYYKYFTGRYRKNEITGSETLYIIKLPLGEFEEKIRKLYGIDKITSFRHKFSVYLRTEQYDRIDMLKRLSILWEVKKDNTSHVETDGAMIETEFRQDFGGDLLAIFSKWKVEQDTTGELMKMDKFIFNFDKLDFLALILTCFPQREDIAYIFPHDRKQDWCSILERRFFASNNLYDIVDYSWLFYIMGNLLTHDIYVMVREYIKRGDIKRQCQWKYGAICMHKETGEWRWNSTFIRNITLNKKAPLKVYANLMEPWLSFEQYNDLCNLDVDDYSCFRGTEIFHHPYISAAIRWIQLQKKERK